LVPAGIERDFAQGKVCVGDRLDRFYAAPLQGEMNVGELNRPGYRGGQLV